MGSSSSSYAPKTIYLDVDGKVQKVGQISVKISYTFDLFIFIIVKFFVLFRALETNYTYFLLFRGAN